MSNGTTTTPIAGGFRWPWQTPPGEGFIAPWTPQESYIDPTTGQMVYQPAPSTPTAPTQPTGPNYGPYSDPGQIPPELLELYDWEPFDQSYVDENGKTAHITMYRLIPKAGMGEAEKRRIELAEAEFMAKYGTPEAGEEEGYPLPSGQAQTTWDDSGMEWFWNEYAGRYEQTGRYNQAYDMRLQQAQAQAGAPGTPEAMSEWQQGQLQLAQQQLAAEQSWKQQEYGLTQQQLAQEQQNYLAQMATQPKSWLEYAAASGTPPVVQPWMLPLMPQEYAGLEGLRAGQPIPGWPEQFAGTNVGAYGGGYAPETYQPYGGGQAAAPATGGTATGGLPAGYGGTAPTGYGGAIPTGYETSIPASRFSAYGTPAQGLVSGNLGTLSNYIAQGMSPYDAALQAYKDAVASGQDPEYAEYATEDALRLYWEQTGTKPTTSGLAGLQISSLGTRPEIAARYGEAIGNVESGQPLMGGLSSREKMSLIGDMVNAGWDRTLAERYVFGGAERYRPYKTIPETTTPTYTPTTPTYEPTPSPTTLAPKPYEPTRTTTPVPQLPEPGKPTTLAPKPYEPEKTYTYTPGRSWHEASSSNLPSGATWLARLEQLPTSGDTQTTAQTPEWMSQTSSSPTGSSSLPLSGMPTLVRPSRQYQARMGPTALQQYYSYAQGRTGITPEEMQWRLWNMAPPGGSYGGLRWTR